MPRRSAAYAVFEAVGGSGVAAGRRRDRELVAGNHPDYYVEEEEFERLTDVLPALGDVKKGLGHSRTHEHLRPDPVS